MVHRVSTKSKVKIKGLLLWKYAVKCVCIRALAVCLNICFFYCHVLIKSAWIRQPGTQSQSQVASFGPFIQTVNFSPLPITGWDFFFLQGLFMRSQVANAAYQQETWSKLLMSSSRKSPVKASRKITLWSCRWILKVNMRLKSPTLQHPQLVSSRCDQNTTASVLLL